MHDWNNHPQPDQPLNPEDQLDLLLEKFLQDPNDEIPVLEEIPEPPAEEPAVAEAIPEAPEMPAEPAPEEALTPEAQLDALLASFLAEPLPEDPDAVPTQLQELDLNTISLEPTDEPAPIPTQIPELYTEEAEEDADALSFDLPDYGTDTPAEEAEEAPIEEAFDEEESVEDEEESDAELPPVVILPELDTDEPAEEEDTPVAEVADEDEPDEDEDAAETETEDTSAQEAAESDSPFILPGFEQDAPQQPEDTPEETEEDPALSEEEELALQQIMAEFLAEETPEDEPAEALPEEPAQPAEEPEPQPAEEPQPIPQVIPVEVPAEIPAEEPEQPEEAPEAAEENPEDKPEEPKKRRPKNTKKYGLLGIPHILTTLVWLGIIVFIGVGLGKFVWNCAADVLALGKPDSVVVITITDEDDLDDIAQKLKNTGLIRYPSLFKIYGQISEARDSIKSGTFKLNTEFDYHALVDAMSSNQRREQTSVTIPEGYTCAQIFRLLESKGISTVEKLEAAAVSADLGEYWFLEGIERDSANCLEGFLFPDTYTFYLDHDATGVLQKFLDNFNKRFNDSMKIKLDTLNATLADMMRANGMTELYISQHQMTVREVVIIASMIERETASNPESYNIASVIYNRLTNPENYPYLNIDAALVYVLGHGNLTTEDLQYDSPYNTYLYRGLIPGAISNPGSYSLDAALSPTPTDYYFYALNPFTGEHHFSKTLKEHNEFLESIRKQQEELEQEEEAQG